MNRSMSPELRRILLEAAVIVTLGVVVGLSLHYPLIFASFSSGHSSVLPAPGAPVVYPQPAAGQQVQLLLQQGALAVDARSPEAFAAGHLPGARSLPLAEAEELLDTFRREVASDRPLIVYCSGYGCPDSFDLGLLLLAAGYTEVYAYEGGLPEWRDSGRPVSFGEEP
jgi:rhodanese-related sulfurtransferase